MALLQYTTAICPPQEIVEQVRLLKQELKKEVGWFSACNAEAHITFDRMDLKEEDLPAYKKSLSAFAATQKPVQLLFSGFSHFTESRTVFLSPETATAALIEKMFGDYHSIVPAHMENIHPHLTIGKGLRPPQFRKAMELFLQRPYTLSFICDNLALRKFDERRKQYFIEERFSFGPGL